MKRDFSGCELWIPSIQVYVLMVIRWFPGTMRTTWIKSLGNMPHVSQGDSYQIFLWNGTSSRDLISYFFSVTYLFVVIEDSNIVRPIRLMDNLNLLCCILLSNERNNIMGTIMKISGRSTFLKERTKLKSLPNGNPNASEGNQSPIFPLIPKQKNGRKERLSN